jgi:tetratricopeptide (TPR) repeat protein
MTRGGEEDPRGPQRPAHAGGRGDRPGQQGGKPGPRPKRPGGLRLRRIGGDNFEFDHPRCVLEMELDYAEGIELWQAGDPEAARDALRYALQGCGDNLWVHVALGRIALDEFKDPSLARGHFGYAFELAERAIPPGFTGRFPRDREANRPFYETVDGLLACYEALGKSEEALALRTQAARLSADRPRDSGPAGPRRPGP